MLFTGAVPKCLHSKPRSSFISIFSTLCSLETKLLSWNTTHTWNGLLCPSRALAQLCTFGACNYMLQGKKKKKNLKWPSFHCIFVYPLSCCITSPTKFCNYVQLWGRSTKYRCKYQEVFNTALCVDVLPVLPSVSAVCKTFPLRVCSVRWNFDSILLANCMLIRLRFPNLSVFG